jgi:EmrB/QacA subfamily drug resistance transporter
LRKISWKTGCSSEIVEPGAIQMIFREKQWREFIAFIPTVALTFMDQTILPVALPTIQQEFGATSTELQWCVNAYLLAIAVFVLVSGKLSDRIGHRNALCLGMAGFAFFSALCSLSPNILVLIGARGLQGLSAAFMFPAQSAIVAQTFSQATRGRAMGMIVSVGSLFLILGPLIGGYLTEAFSWHWIFWINLPIAATGLWMILAFLPTPKPGVEKIDLLGFIFFAIGSSSLVLFFMQAADWGWTSTKALICVVMALIALFLLMKREKKTAHPFLDLTLFKRPVYTAINISVAITQFIMMITVFQTIYFQEILEYTPFQTGLIVFVSSCPVFFMAPIAGFLSDRLSPKWPIALGYLSLIFSFFWLAFFSTPSLSGLLAALIAFGVGIPLIFTPSYSSAISSVPPGKTGVAIGMILTLRMLGGAMGLALINLFVSTVQQMLRPVEGDRLAVITSFSRIHFALAFLLIIAFAVTFVLHNRKSAHHLPDAPAEGWD